VDAQYLEIARIVALGRIAADSLIAQHPAQALADLFVRANEWFKRENEEVEQLLERVTSASKELATLLDQKIGELPDPQEILLRANEQLIERQMMAQREADALERKAAELQTQTLTDALTGAANRKRFDSCARESFETARARQKPLAILFVDVDRFKSVNDTHGHQAGDAVLVELARRLINTVGDFGTVCRYGGEEFAIILPNANVVKASRIAELLRHSIGSAPFDLSEVQGVPDALTVTVSLGVSAMERRNEGRHETVGQLVKEADESVYEAKRAGRNCVRVFGRKTAVPKMKGQALPVAAEQASQGSRFQARLLLVEHEPMTAGVLQKAFASVGVGEVTVVRSLEQARARLCEWQSAGHATAGLVVTAWKLTDGGAEALRGDLCRDAVWSLWRLVVLADDEGQRAEAAELVSDGGEVFCKKDIAADPADWARRVWDDYRRRAEGARAA